MSTVRRKIVNGKILNEVGELVDYEIVRGNWNNPWVIQIINGELRCHCEAIYADGRREYNKSFPLEDGTLGLSGGRIDDRYAYFRSQKFQNFLEENHLVSINPKFIGIWDGEMMHSNCTFGTASFCIFTDGEYTHLGSEVAAWTKEANPKFAGQDSVESYQIKNAKWAIIGIAQHYRKRHNRSVVLHVQKAVTLSALKFPDEIKTYLKDFSSTSTPMVKDNIIDRCKIHL